MENDNNTNTSNTNDGAKRARTGLEGSVWAPGNSSARPALQTGTRGGAPPFVSAHQASMEEEDPERQAIRQAAIARGNPLFLPEPAGSSPLGLVQAAVAMSRIDPTEQAMMAIDVSLFQADQATRKADLVRREAEFARTMLNRARNHQVPRPGFVVEGDISEATSSRPQDRRVNPAPMSGAGSIPWGNDRGRSRGRSRGGPVSSGGVQKTQAPKVQGALAARITAPTREMKRVLDKIDPSNPVELSDEAVEAEKREADRLKSAEAARARRAATKCGNCGQMGHELADCAHPSMDGYVHGCPIHNTREHEFGNACPLNDESRPRTRRAILKWAMQRRANRPTLACFTNWFVVLRKYVVCDNPYPSTVPAVGPWTPDHVRKLLDDGKAPWQGFDYEENDLNKLGFDPMTGNLRRIKENYGLLFGLDLPKTDSPLQMEIDVAMDGSASDDDEELHDLSKERGASGFGMEFNEAAGIDDYSMLDDDSLVPAVQPVNNPGSEPGPAGDYDLNLEDEVDFGDGNDDFVRPLTGGDDGM